jgi:hypothetical protein
MGRQLGASTGLIIQEEALRRGPQQESWRPQVGGEVPGRSLGGKILIGPLRLLR